MRGRGLRARNKKPGAASRPGGWRSFGEYAFLEDSRYTSQAESADLDCGGFVAFVTGGETETPVSQRFPGIARSALVAPSARNGEARRAANKAA
jgi:hypothetical protein